MDIVAIPRTMPSPGDEVTLDRLDIVCGGAAFNCAVAAARAGTLVKALGLVGEDEFGAQLLRELSDHGVDASQVQSRPGRTGTVVSIVAPGGERTLYSYRGVNGEQFTALPSLRAGDHVYLSGYSLQEASSRQPARELKRRAALAGAVCLLDPSFQSAATLVESGFLEGLDWITPNAAESRLMTGGMEPAVLRALGVRNAVITLGAEGCVLETPSIPCTLVPSETVAGVNSTGAGDAFCGGLLAALMKGCCPLEAASFANRAAASALCGGGRPETPRSSIR